LVETYGSVAAQDGPVIRGCEPSEVYTDDDYVYWSAPKRAHDVRDPVAARVCESGWANRPTHEVLAVVAVA
jgi:hypothetical protein